MVTEWLQVTGGQGCCGDLKLPLDADLYLPPAWPDDRPRCRAAGIPDAVRYRSEWRVALDQLIRLHRNGLRFDWLVFDRGYGNKVPFMRVLGLLGQTFVAEVSVTPITAAPCTAGPIVCQLPRSTTAARAECVERCGASSGSILVLDRFHHDPCYSGINGH